MLRRDMKDRKKVLSQISTYEKYNARGKINLMVLTAD